jgi:hypothetical protein
MSMARIAIGALLAWLLAWPVLAPPARAQTPAAPPAATLLGPGRAPAAEDAARGFCAEFGRWAMERSAAPIAIDAPDSRALIRRLLELRATRATEELRAANLDELGAPAWLGATVQRFEITVPEALNTARLALMPVLLWHTPGATDPLSVVQVQLAPVQRLEDRRAPIPGEEPGKERRTLKFEIAMPDPPAGPGWWPRAAPASMLVVGCADRDLAFLAARRAGVLAERPALVWALLGLGLAYFVVAGASPGSRAVRQSADATAWLRLRSWFDPVLITQDEYGFGSLRRLQLLYFTFVIFGLSLYILLRAGYLSAISEQLLWLMGIAAGGTAFASMADRLRAPEAGPGAQGPSRETIRLLARVGIIERRDQFGSWLDVVTEGPGLGLHRVQAVIFSLLVGIFIVSQGKESLAALAIPDSYLVLIGLSQAVYVGIYAASPRADWAGVNAAAEAFRAAVPDSRARFTGGRAAALAALSEEQRAAYAALRRAAAGVMPRLAPDA